MTSEVGNGIDELLELFSNSDLTPFENLNNILNAFEAEMALPQFRNAVSAIRSGNRQKVTESLFLGSYRFLSEMILADPRVTQDDVSLILSNISQQLPSYDPSTHELGFLAWCESIIQRQIEFYAMRRQYRNSVRKGLWSVLSGCADLGFDLAAFSDVENKVWTKIYLQLDDLLKPGSAALSTRLYAAGRYEARAWRTSRLRERERFTTLDELVKIEEGLAKPRRTRAQAFELAKVTEITETVQ